LLPPSYPTSPPSRYSASERGDLTEKYAKTLPADPNGYRIKRVEDRVEDGREVFWVFLDCCYLGDIAVIDKESGAVLSFRPGAK
jgi:hypothetical protein